MEAFVKWLTLEDSQILSSAFAETLRRFVVSNEFYAVLIGALIGWLFTSWHRSIVELVRYRHIKKLKDAFHDSWAGVANEPLQRRPH
jgi:hypothetical protein